MTENAQDHENWRDDSPAHPRPEPDEHQYRFYSHDYPADTTLDYLREGNHAELTLSFSSEDPDMGVEEMVCRGENRETFAELVAHLRKEITGYLDAADASPTDKPQGQPMEAQDVYGEYSRTALYAFEAILSQTEKELQRDLTWRPLEPARMDWLYSGSAEQDLERGCVGHLRGDFGQSGREFWTSWFDHLTELKSTPFHDELQRVVNGLRKENGLLRSFATMSRQCRDGLSCDGSFGFQAESPNYTYCLRCIPRRGDNHFYLYAYDKNAQREHERQKDAAQTTEQRPEKHKIRKNEKER